ncbi:hypothetical protein ADUPG1_008201, partial [Aduncisulcus paluster]
MSEPPNLESLTYEYLSPFEKEEYLFKQGGKRKVWRKRWFALKDGWLYYFKNQRDLRESPSGAIKVYDSIVESCLISGKTNTFSIKTSDRTYFLHAESRAPKDQWIKDLLAISDYGKPLTLNLAMTDAPTYRIELKGMKCKECADLAYDACSLIEGFEFAESDIANCAFDVWGSFISSAPLLDALREVGFVPKTRGERHPDAKITGDYMKRKAARDLAKPSILNMQEQDKQKIQEIQEKNAEEERILKEKEAIEAELQKEAERKAKMKKYEEEEEDDGFADDLLLDLDLAPSEKEEEPVVPVKGEDGEETEDETFSDDDLERRRREEEEEDDGFADDLLLDLDLAPSEKEEEPVVPVKGEDGEETEDETFSDDDLVLQILTPEEERKKKESEEQK